MVLKRLKKLGKKITGQKPQNAKPQNDKPQNAKPQNANNVHKPRNVTITCGNKSIKAKVTNVTNANAGILPSWFPFIGSEGPKAIVSINANDLKSLTGQASVGGKTHKKRVVKKRVVKKTVKKPVKKTVKRKKPAAKKTVKKAPKKKAAPKRK